MVVCVSDYLYEAMCKARSGGKEEGNSVCFSMLWGTIVWNWLASYFFIRNKIKQSYLKTVFSFPKWTDFVQGKC